MMEDAELLRINKLKNQHKDVFSIFELNYLDNDVETSLMYVLKFALHNSSTMAIERNIIILSNIKSIIDSYMVKLQEIHIIPNNAVSFKKKLKHLSGNIDKSNAKPTTIVYQNRIIHNLHQWVYNTSCSYIKSIKKDPYNQYIISDYSIESLKSGLLELLLWFKRIYGQKIYDKTHTELLIYKPKLMYNRFYAALCMYKINIPNDDNPDKYLNTEIIDLNTEIDFLPIYLLPRIREMVIDFIEDDGDIHYAFKNHIETIMTGRTVDHYVEMIMTSLQMQQLFYNLKNDNPVIEILTSEEAEELYYESTNLLNYLDLLHDIDI